MRAAMGEAAVRAAEAINYVGAGTVEFIVDVSSGLDNAPFYFMEMNTRLQVEHPVTEMITGQDLVEWQILVAEGKALPLAQDQLEAHLQGHAVEVRLYAEDPQKDFMPSIGEIGHFDPFAEPVAGGRIDAGVRAGDTVSIHYDPMIGKLIAWGEDREQAISSLTNLVADTPVTGLVTNRDFLMRILSHPQFQKGDVHTGFIEQHEAELFAVEKPSCRDYALAAFAIVASRQNRVFANDPWHQADNFRLNLTASEKLWFDTGEGDFLTVDMLETGHDFVATIEGETFNATNVEADGRVLSLTYGGLRTRHFYSVDDAQVTIVHDKCTVVLNRHARSGGDDNDTDGPGAIIAPMPGKILDVKVKNGDFIEKGAPVLVMEAMKMEQTITAPKDGTVTGLNLEAGAQVNDGAVLLTIEEKQ